MEQISGEEIVRNLDLAADIFTNPLAGDEQRKSAERYFLDLRNAKLSFDLFRFILEHSTKEFVYFQIISSMNEAVIREWPFLDQSSISGVCEYLLSFISRPGLPNFVVAEGLRTIAVIVKRGTFDKKSIESSRLLDLASQWIASGDANLQSLACQLLLSVCNEYCTSWRSSGYGLTWDFHIRAKRFFETTDLRRVFELCLQVLHYLLTNIQSLNDNGGYWILAARLLYVAESVLSWNFGSKLLPKRLMSTVEFSSAVCLKPGDTWRSLLLESNVVQFFFELYHKTKLHEELCRQVLQCLIQLATLTGSVFANEVAKGQYFHGFVGCLVDLLKSDNHRAEPIALSQILQKLFSFFPTNLFFSLPEDLVNEFLLLLSQLTCRYGVDVTKENADESETKFEEAYEKLLIVWGTLVDGAENIEYLKNPCKEIFLSYVHCHLAAPYGARRLTSDRQEISEVVEDDRDHYAEVLKNIGKIGRCNYDIASEQIFMLAKERINQFCRYLAQVDAIQGISNGFDMAVITNHQEDMHWLFLVIGSLLVSGDNGCLKIPAEIFRLSTRTVSGNVNVDSVQIYINYCMLSPTADTENSLVNVDHFIRLFGIVIRWASIELLAADNDRNFELLSPQVAQTTLWCLGRIIAACNNCMDADKVYGETPLLKQLKAGIPWGTLTEFVIQKSLKVLAKWNGEVQLAKDAVGLLTKLVQSKAGANEVGGNTNLFSELQNINVQQLSPLARCELLKCVIVIGSSTDMSAIQGHICDVVLSPLIGNFCNLVQSHDFASTLFAKESVQTMILDWFDCFSGIAQAATSQTAQTLFSYLTPVLEIAPNLLCTFKNHQPLIDAVLQFYVDVTRKIAISLEQNESCAKLYSCLLALLNSYSANNTSKYVGNVTLLEEEKMSDLLLLLQVLTNILSKDVFITINPEDNGDGFTAATVVLMGLNIVSPLMTNEFLKYPSLCVQYFKVLAHFFEMYPEKVCRTDGKTLEMLLEFVLKGLTGDYCNEVTKLTLDALNSLSTFAAQCSADYCVPVRERLWPFLRPVFESCLNTSGEVDLLNDSSMTLYSLICCTQSHYNAMVDGLISSHADPVVQQRLTSAFRSLLPNEVMTQPLRREKLAFRDRFELFLDEVQGLLCL